MHMDDQALSQALIALPHHEDDVRRGFWAKVQGVAGRVPFLDRAVACYFAATDPVTPLRVKATLFAALAYFIMPADMIPDIIALAGFTDDLAVLMLAIKTVAPHITDDHLRQARDALGQDHPQSSHQST